MAAKGVYLSLRMGVDRATLPDNRTMKAGSIYLISVDDFQRLSRSVRESVVSVNGIETKSRVVTYSTGDGYQFVDLAGYSNGDANDIADMGWKVGKVLQGLNGEAFKLCKVVGDDALAGDVLVWSAENRYGWVQTEGVVSAAHAPGVGAGDSLKVTTDGKFDTANEDGDTVGTALSGVDGDEMIEAALRSTRARNRYVKRPNLFYPGQ